ncbi:MAG: tRNA (cytidine(34)-2'-O)-methyltransferase [Sodalis sp.]|nr:MAG: tRNA (cytidine(34)-2'-O)-methyltransferase [Sodalis sp.]
MLNILSYRLEVLPATGCARIPVQLIEALGFIWDDKRLRRMGLDYREFAALSIIDHPAGAGVAGVLFALTTKGPPAHSAVAIRLRAICYSGQGTYGLSPSILCALPMAQKIRISDRQPQHESVQCGVACGAQRPCASLNYIGARQ